MRESWEQIEGFYGEMPLMFIPWNWWANGLPEYPAAVVTAHWPVMVWALDGPAMERAIDAFDKELQGVWR